MLTENQTSVMNTIVNAVRVAHKRGAFSLEEAAVVGAAIQALANSMVSSDKTQEDGDDSVEDSSTPAPTTEFNETTVAG
jgi:hypothetical protein